MPSPRKRHHKDNLHQLHLFPRARVENIGEDAKGNPIIRVVPDSELVVWLRPKQFAHALSIGMSTVYDWLRSGVIHRDKWERRGPKVIYIQATEVDRLRDTGDK
ncbi:hypothetical protein [Geminisphaera colitermitum]|uniref:hypothetical protein n=1 Tax=Geminisphaera colitermitum TaxID=1148786 RepID=UPI000158D57E|nr:hypothetical protein [Geminisphaera colitermitum]